nr:MAG TPA: hypothetical protein [Caudoviricetes sp.]DAW21775.1 MAG TPA: hypothetical protein [Caudoviricetes sp.]
MVNSSFLKCLPSLFLLSIKRSILYENLIQSRMACIKKCEFFRLVRVPFFLRKGGTFYEN